MATRTISNAGGNWNSTGAWAESTVPVDGDDVVATASSGNLAVNVDTAKLRSFDLTGYASTLSGTGSIILKVTSGTVTCKFSVGTFSWTGLVYIQSEGSAVVDFYPGTYTYANHVVFGSDGGFGSYTGTINLKQKLTVSSTKRVFCYSSVFDTNSNDIDCGAFFGSSNGNTRTILLRASTITILGNSSLATDVWDMTQVNNTTFNSGASTIKMTNSSAYFSGGGLTYYNLTMSGDAGIIKGSNTFNTINVNNAGLSTGLRFSIGTTQTVSNFASNGSAGSLAKILSNSAGTSFSLSKSSGLVVCDYLSIKDSVATGGASWYAGSHSTNVSGNSGWIFSDLPFYPYTQNAFLLSGD